MRPVLKPPWHRSKATEVHPFPSNADFLPDRNQHKYRNTHTHTHTHTHLSCFPSGSDGKESACNAGDLSSIPRLGRFPEGGHGNPLQCSCLENPHIQRSLVDYSPQGCKESDIHIGIKSEPTLEHYSAVKWNEVLMQVSKWMELQNTPSEKTQTQKVTLSYNTV